MKKKGGFITKQHLTILGKFVFSIICILLVFHFGKIDVHQFFDNLRTVKLVWALLALIILISVFILGAIRWKILLSEEKNLSIIKLTKYYFIGGFFNTFLPSTVGGDFIRAYLLKKQQIKIRIGLSSVLIERLLGLSALVLLSFFAVLIELIFFPNIYFKFIIYIVAIGFLFVFIWLMFFYLNRIRLISNKLFSFLPDKILVKLNAIFEAFELIGKSRHNLLYGFIISLLIQFLSIVSVFIIAISLNIHLEFIYFLIYVPFISIISFIPLSISGLGIRESAFVYFFVPLGVAASKAFTLSLLLYLLIVILGIIGAIIFIFSNEKISTK